MYGVASNINSEFIKELFFSVDLYTAVVRSLSFIMEHVTQTTLPSLIISSKPPCPHEATGIL